MCMCVYIYICMELGLMSIITKKTHNEAVRNFIL